MIGLELKTKDYYTAEMFTQWLQRKPLDRSMILYYN